MATEQTERTVGPAHQWRRAAVASPLAAPVHTVYDAWHELDSRASVNVPQRDYGEPGREVQAKITVFYCPGAEPGARLDVRTGDSHWSFEEVPLDTMQALAVLLPTLFQQAIRDGTIPRL